MAADATSFTDVLGGRLLFAIEGMGARVAMVELTPDPPRVLLAGHLEGDRPSGCPDFQPGCSGQA